MPSIRCLHDLGTFPGFFFCRTRRQELYDCIKDFFVSSTMSKKKGARLRLESRSSGGRLARSVYCEADGETANKRKAQYRNFSLVIFSLIFRSRK